MVRHSKRSLWAAAAAGVLILATGPAGLAQSLSTDTSVSRSVAGQGAKMAAVLDSLKSAGLVQSSQRAAEAIKEARVSAEVQTQVQAPAQAPGPDMATRSLIDALKAAGRLQASQRAAQAAKEAGVGTGAQGPSQAPGKAPGTGTTQASQSLQEALEAARVASQQTLENARVASEQALEQAREQAGMTASALAGAPRGFREAVERTSMGSHSTTNNAGRAGHSGATSQ